MIKKILSTVLFSVVSVYGFSQCTPDPNNTTLISPDTVTNFASGTVGTAYSQIILVHPPDDTTAVVLGNPVTVDVTNIVLDALGNLPPGLTYACNPPSCVFAGGTSGCVLISGTPTTAGTYPLQAIITTSGTIFNGTIPVSQTDTIFAYSITILPNTSGVISQSGNSNFQLLQSGPNPTKDYFTFKFTSPLVTNASLQVFNILGKKVIDKHIVVKTGENIVNFSTKNLSAGVYVYSIKNGPYNLTKRFVVAGK